MNGSAPKTLQEIRDLMRKDFSLITDQHLIALVLARGSEGRQGTGGHMKAWTAVELAEDLLAEAGGNLARFVRAKADSRFGLTRFGIRGSAVGVRLIAAVGLSFRWDIGFTDGGNRNIRPDHEGALQEILLRGRHTSEAELMAVILGDKNPDKDNARRLLEEFGSPRELMRSLALDVFEAVGKQSKVFLRLPKTGGEIEDGSFCRLFAAVQLAHRYSIQSTLTPVRLRPGALGFESDELVELLNPRSSLALEVREGMIESLRLDPQLARDFAKLDRFALDVQTSNYQSAAVLSLLFEELCERRTWAHPSQILGMSVPYDALLTIANARLKRSAAPPRRILEVKELLKQAAQDAIAGPVDSFVEALVKLNLPKKYVEKALEAVRRRCIEPAHQPQRQRHRA